MKDRVFLMLALLMAPVLYIYGGTAGDADGHLLFLFALAVLGIVLGIMYLAGYIRYLIRKYFSQHDHKDGVHA